MLGPEVFFPNPLPAEAGPSDAQIHAMQQEIQEHEDYFRNRNRREPEENIDLMLGAFLRFPNSVYLPTSI